MRVESLRLNNLFIVRVRVSPNSTDDWKSWGHHRCCENTRFYFLHHIGEIPRRVDVTLNIKIVFENIWRLTCSQSPDGVGAGLQPEVTGQGRDGGHEADYQGVDLDDLVQLVDDHGAEELQAESDGEGGEPLEGQTGGWGGVELSHLRGHSHNRPSYSSEIPPHMSTFALQGVLQDWSFPFADIRSLNIWNKIHHRILRCPCYFYDCSL